MLKRIFTKFSRHRLVCAALAGGLVLSACAQAPTVPPPSMASSPAVVAQPIDALSPQKSLAKVHAGALLLDVRSPEEFAQGHLRDAVNVPHTQVSTVLPRLEPNKNREIVLYCGSGRRASLAQAELQKQGYQQVLNAGSYSNLKAQEE
ncbi:MAG: rhodanese-like domain-containing protein [Deltaproteobacteria bacterium]|nr:rhodanese-like domain-containing protein [Deltaproteobacteria bacterium]